MNSTTTARDLIYLKESDNIVNLSDFSERRKGIKDKLESRQKLKKQENKVVSVNKKEEDEKARNLKRNDPELYRMLQKADRYGLDAKAAAIKAKEAMARQEERLKEIKRKKEELFKKYPKL